MIRKPETSLDQLFLKKKKKKGLDQFILRLTFL